jgi:hypothetical protein
MTRQSLKDVLADRDVLARCVLSRSPGEHATTPQDFHRGRGMVAATGARQTPRLEAWA